jgi:murein DD-endopeptidase MepM/ murein hydrolase activator NlpD
MIFTAQQMRTSALDEATALLENASYLSDAEARYYPEMVPIRENTRLQRNVIRVEDLVEYSLSNGISDGGVSLQQICEASGIDMGSVVFSVDEVNVLEDVNMEETVRGLIKAGAQVYAAPVSESDMASIMAESVTELMIYGEESGQSEITNALFEAFVDDDFDYLFNEGEMVSKVKEKAAKAGNAVVTSSTSVASKVEAAIKQAATKSRQWIAKKISAFRTILGRYKDRIRKKGEYEPGVKGVINKVIAKIKQAIEYLSGLLKKALD